MAWQWCAFRSPLCSSMCTCRHHKRRLRIQRQQCAGRGPPSSRKRSTQWRHALGTSQVVTASLDIKKQNDPLLEGKFKELAKLHEALNTQVKAAYKLHVMDTAPADAKELFGKIDATIDLLGHHRTGWGHSRKRFNAYIASFSRTSFSCRQDVCRYAP